MLNTQEEAAIRLRQQDYSFVGMAKELGLKSPARARELWIVADQKRELVEQGIALDTRNLGRAVNALRRMIYNWQEKPDIGQVALESLRHASDTQLLRDWQVGPIVLQKLREIQTRLSENQVSALIRLWPTKIPYMSWGKWHYS